MESDATSATRNWFSTDIGASMVEYALLLSLIVLVAFATVQLMGGRLATTYDTIATAVSSASG